MNAPKLPPAFNPFHGKLSDIPDALSQCQRLKGCGLRGVCYAAVIMRTLFLSAAGMIATAVGLAWLLYKIIALLGG